MTPEFEQQIKNISTRLSKIENYLGIPNTTVNSNLNQVAQSSESPAESHWKAGQELSLGSPEKWLGVIAVICFVFAAGFIIKLSIDSGWLTPDRRVGLAIIFGFCLIATGFLVRKSDYEYSNFLPAAGIIILYCSNIAAHVMYGLITFEVALAGSCVISGLCIWLYIVFEHDVYAVVAAVGAYLAPSMFYLHNHLEFYLYYILLCSITFILISIWLSSRLLTLFSAYLAIFTTTVLGMPLNAEFVAVLLALNFIIFCVGTLCYTKHHNKPLTLTEAYSYLPALLLFYAAEYYFIHTIAPNLAPYISLIFVGILIGLYVSARRFSTNLNSQGLICIFASIVAFHAVYLEILPDNMKPWLLPVSALLISYFLEVIISHYKKHNYLIPLILLGLIFGIEYMRMLAQLMGAKSDYWLLVTLATTISIWILSLHVKTNRHNSESDNYGDTLLFTAHILAITGFYNLTFEYSSLLVSISWLLYAMAVIGLAYYRKDPIMAKSALFVLAFAAGKALLYDAASAPTVLRIICLLCTGVVLYACGLLFRKIVVLNKA